MSNVSDVAASTGLRTYEDYLQSTKKGGAKSLGKNEFLQLLAAQLQYQNPLEPMSDSDFVAQLAQFSSLEQMEALNTTMTNYQYYSLAGKYVAADTKLEDGRIGTVIGIVDSVFTKNGTSYSELGSCIFIDKDGNTSALDESIIIPSSSISQVYDSNLFGAGSGGASLLEASSLIGRTITAKISVTETETGEDGEEKQVTNTKEVSGVVSRVAMTEKGIYAYIGEGDSEIAVPVSNITGIKE